MRRLKSNINENRIIKTFNTQQEILNKIEEYSNKNIQFTFDDFKNIIYKNSEITPKLDRSIERNINRYIVRIRENNKKEIKIKKINNTKVYFIKSDIKNIYPKKSKFEKVQDIINNNQLNKNNPNLIQLINYHSRIGKCDYLLYPLEIVDHIKEPFIRAILVSEKKNSEKLESVKAVSNKIKRFYFSRMSRVYGTHSVKYSCPIITKVLREYNSYKNDDFNYLFQKKSELKKIKFLCSSYFEIFLKSKYKNIYNIIKLENRIKSIYSISNSGVVLTKEIDINYIHIESLVQLLIGHLNHIQIKNSQSAKRQIMDYLSKNL